MELKYVQGRTNLRPDTTFEFHCTCSFHSWYFWAQSYTYAVYIYLYVCIVKMDGHTMQAKCLGVCLVYTWLIIFRANKKYNMKQCNIREHFLTPCFSCLLFYFWRLNVCCQQWKLFEFRTPEHIIYEREFNQNTMKWVDNKNKNA